MTFDRSAPYARAHTADALFIIHELGNANDKTGFLPRYRLSICDYWAECVSEFAAVSKPSLHEFHFSKTSTKTARNVMLLQKPSIVGQCAVRFLEIGYLHFRYTCTILAFCGRAKDASTIFLDRSLKRPSCSTIMLSVCSLGSWNLDSRDAKWYRSCRDSSKRAFLLVLAR